MTARYHVVTYATHSQGMFPALLNNRYDIHVNVLGWGQSWHGYTDKIQGVHDFCSRIPETDIVIFLDAFDTVINKHPDIAVAQFLKMQPLHGILVSVEKLHAMWPFYRRQFGENFLKCRINPGMYMGYAGRLHRFLHRTLQQATGDDQRAFNNCCEYVTRDTSTFIFHNIGVGFKTCPQVDHLDAAFVSFPGSGGCGSAAARLAAYYHHKNSWMHQLSTIELCGVLVVMILICALCRNAYKRMKPRQTFSSTMPKT